ncbi:MAG: GNAT family N-acetyltransferase [Proteobacteria bacterium]|nr:GNAT family N-acetyltransferase [Pseudomonadota bacterium]
MALTRKWDDDLTLPTERLVIRAIYPSDAPLIYAAIMETLPHLQEWMPWASPAPALADTESFCKHADAQRKAGKDLILIAVDKTTGAHVLSTGIHPKDTGVPSFEIGYWCRASKQGQGYVTEVVKALTDYAFTHLGARRVQIHCDADNAKSAAVPRRCGFIEEGRMKHHALKPDTGDLRDTLIFARCQ